MDSLFSQISNELSRIGRYQIQFLLLNLESELLELCNFFLLNLQRRIPFTKHKRGIDVEIKIDNQRIYQHQ